MNFWETPEWVQLKTIASHQQTDTLLSKTEYLRMVGAKEFTEEKYQAYLKTMQQKEEQRNATLSE